MSQTAAGFEQLFCFVGDRDDWVAAQLEVIADHAGLVMDIDHGPVDAAPHDLIKRMVDQGLAGDRDQRLGAICRQRTHARPQASCIDHGSAGSVHWGIANFAR